jgi:hypothetical protein
MDRRVEAVVLRLRARLWLSAAPQRLHDLAGVCLCACHGVACARAEVRRFFTSGDCC